MAKERQKDQVNMFRKRSHYWIFFVGEKRFCDQFNLFWWLIIVGRLIAFAFFGDLFCEQRAGCYAE